MSPDIGAIVAVHHDSAFGMHVDPPEPAVEAEGPEDDNQRSATTTAASRQAAGASS